MPSEIPLLSICIPTFNRAELLELCLSTLLPQLALVQKEVECVISDNASSDRTSAVVAEFAASYPVRAFRNEVNLGIIANITKCASELARGEFVLLIGDDDVLCIGAIERILCTLRMHDAPDLVALNVGYLPVSERPPAEQAQGGVQAVSDKTLRSCSTADGIVRFAELFEGPCADLTASYSVVLRRHLWLKYFPSACRDDPFTSVRTTYPTAYIIANSMPGRLSGLISSPTIMIYEMPGSDYSWARYRALNCLIYATLLYRMYEANGVPYRVLRPYYLYQLANRGSELGDLLWNPKSFGGFRHVLQFVWLFKGYPVRLVRMFVVAMSHPDAPWLLAACARLLMRFRRAVLRKQQ